MDLTLSQEQYESLISLARRGTYDPDGTPNADKSRDLEAWLNLIEKANGIKRSLLWVQWQEAGSPLPATASFPTSWPPNLRFMIELLTRPVSKSDVDAVLAQKASKPINVLVTSDPGAELGWTTVADFFTT